VPRVLFTFDGQAAAASFTARWNGPALDEAQTGQALFLAKGCIVCHSHEALAGARWDFGELQFGPNLSNVTLEPDYLHDWLSNPAAMKPGTYMPTLGLSDPEIDALIAFLRPEAATAAGN
jgi:cytochrome c oxidase subunit 2